MLPLFIANVLHHKLRSALGALGVALGICMLLTLSGLARGTLREIPRRWESVDADLIVCPARWFENLATVSGAGMGEADAKAVAALTFDGKPAVEHVVPVFVYQIKIGGQSQNVVGVAAEKLHRLLGDGRILPGGRCFDAQGDFGPWLAGELAAGRDPSPEELAAHGGLEMVIDTRLARKAGLSAGDRVQAAGHEFAIVGIVPAGALARAFIPRPTAEFLFGDALGRYTLLFAKLRQGVPISAAAETIAAGGRLKAVSVGEYRGILEDRFGGAMYPYIDAVNAVTLAVSFLFILVTLFTMILQRTREIAILKSMGAGPGRILAGVLAESLLLTGVGAAAGVGLSFAAAAAIEAVNPLLTVRVTAEWVALAAVVSLVGGAAAGLYPAWRAAGVDVVEALNVE